MNTASPIIGKVGDSAFVAAVREELGQARRKFPESVLSMVALVEEVGELAQALLKYRADEWTWDRVVAEAVQVAVMAQRVAVEGDSSILNADYAEPGE